MKNFIRRIFTLLFILSLISLFTVEARVVNAVNLPTTIYESKTSDYIGSGVLYENIKRFTSRGWWNINVVRVDLENQFTELGGLFSNRGLSTRDNVSNMVKEKNAIAGINGDFFSYNTFASSMGALIENGEIISSPLGRAYALPSFYLNMDKEPGLVFFDRSMNLISEETNKSISINLVNKSADMDMVTLLNKHWGSKSFGNRFNNGENLMVEMLVVDNMVHDIRIDREAVDIPENGYVIAVRGSRQEPLLDNFNIGDRVRLSMDTSPNLENISFAIGGGSIILKDGLITNSNINIAGNHPRTGIAISEDEKELMLVTIDGRGNSYKGVEQNIFAAILKNLGAYNAVNLDGGGSTTMAIKPVAQENVQLVNRPSDGGQRNVVNGVGVFVDAPKGSLSYLKIETDDENMFPDTHRKFNVKGFDQYHNPMDIDNSQLEFSYKGVEGEMLGNSFRAKSSGNLTIRAEYLGKTASMEIKVLKPVKSLIFQDDEFALHPNNKKSLGTVYGLDRDGFKAKIHMEDMEWSVPNDLGYIEEGFFQSSGKIGVGAISGSLANVTNNILLSIGSGEGKLIEAFENIDNFDLITYPNNVEASIALSTIAKEGQNSLALGYNFKQGDGNRAVYALFNPDGDSSLKLESNPNKLSLWVRGDGNGAWLRAAIRDKNGTAHTIDFEKSLNFEDWKYVEANIPTNVSYPISLERIYVVEIDSEKEYSGEVLLDSLKAHYPSSYSNIEAPSPSIFADEKNMKTSKGENGFSFIITRLAKDLDEINGGAVRDKIIKRANSHDLSLLVGKSNDEFNKALKSDLINIATPYKTSRYRNLMIIDASSAKGGIRATNPQQWFWLRDGLANAEEDHILLFLNTPVFASGGFTDPLEAELLHNTLVETFKRGKSVWLIYNGDSNKFELKEGVRYIGLANSENMFEFIVNDKEISYQLLNNF